ncbi:MAG: hypothetical protein AAGC60_00105 [Acidobacteriota bacterium]
MSRFVLWSALAVSWPVVCLAILDLYRHQASPAVAEALILIAAAGIALAGTVGGAYIGRAAVVHREHRIGLAALWTVLVGCLVYLGACHLMAHHLEQDLAATLGPGGLWLYVIAAALIPELAAAGALAVGAIEAGAARKVDALEAELEQAALERNAAEAALRDAQASPPPAPAKTPTESIADTALRHLHAAGEPLSLASLVSVFKAEGITVRTRSLRTALERRRAAGEVVKTETDAGVVYEVAA